MKHLLGKSLSLVTLLVAGLFVADAFAADDKYKEGKHYSVINGASKPKPGGKVEVTEFFWYGCGHCFKFEPVIAAWKKKKADYVVFKGSPAMWKQRAHGVPGDMMWTHAKLYYAASALQVLDKLHPIFFQAMHKQNKRLFKTAEIEKLVDDQKIPNLTGKSFVATMESFAVKSQVEQADRRQKAAKITGTPEIVVGGYYHVTARKAGSQKAMLEIADFLAKKIRDGK